MVSSRGNAEPVGLYHIFSLCHSVAAVDTDVSTRHVAGRLAEEIDDGAHEIFRFAHLADGNERGPVLVEFRIFGQDLLGAIRVNKSAYPMSLASLQVGYVQGRQHVARRDDIDSNARMGPFNSQAARQMSDGSFGGVVRGLWLWDVDDSARH